jgi:hypothetical protein
MAELNHLRFLSPTFENNATSEPETSSPPNPTGSRPHSTSNHNAHTPAGLCQPAYPVQHCSQEQPQRVGSTSFLGQIRAAENGPISEPFVYKGLQAL